MVAPSNSTHSCNAEDLILPPSPPRSSRDTSLDLSHQEEPDSKDPTQRQDVPKDDEDSDEKRKKKTTSKNNSDSAVVDTAMLERVSAEIEGMRQFQAMQRRHGNDISNNNNNNNNSSRKRPCTFRKFPPACLTVLQHLPGNDRCVDCGACGPQWASVSLGVLLCLNCSGYHRSLGVQVSCVRSITMDEWSVTDILRMMEGGNGQLATFFARHQLCRSSTKAVTTKTTSSSSRIHRDNVTEGDIEPGQPCFIDSNSNCTLDNYSSDIVPTKGETCGAQANRNCNTETRVWTDPDDVTAAAASPD
eukprot:CAMPEP_0168787712 /NCGR_PEP_ID=MMETSP0725-20121227/11947_1 /TAXON_ID=265536 /ORGANISM="Amphiprora sp., Strain CCMP467" /LENGTH=302 /DNA_ID=CAMNT_0008837937 /DNA_START=1291 /DNA_END=2200 /DNA_ORIENTATION=-